MLFKCGDTIKLTITYKLFYKIIIGKEDKSFIFSLVLLLNKYVSPTLICCRTQKLFLEYLILVEVKTYEEG